ncbi:MAG: sugar transferase [Microbacteriaceae bacterium]|jgi:exopolysaccharide biosynthesis polyprenyl glycosylphosphotransferase|nr:sugar transferase [Microbacteriaceae bacterium]
MVEIAVTRTRSRRNTTRNPIRRRGVAPADDSLPVFPASGALWASSYRTKLRASDTIIVIAAIGAAFVARFGIADLAAYGSDSAVRYGSMAILVFTVWSATLSAFRSRQPRVMGVGADEYKRVFNASTSTFGVLGGVFLVVQADTARWFLTIAFPVGLAGLVLSRWLWRRWLIRQRANGHFLSRVLVTGARPDVEKVVSQVRANCGAAYTVVGAVVGVDDDQTELDDVVVLSDLTRIAEFAKTLAVDGVIVAGHPHQGGEFIHDLAWQLEGGTAELILATSLANVAGPRIHFRPVEGLPLIHVEIPQFDGAKHAVKRAMDIVLSSVALLVLAPVFGVIAVLIRLDSEGPVLFAQERVGRQGELFQILKFRSMNAEAPRQLQALIAQSEGNGTLFKMKNDPRVTRLGRTLRKYSLDELPQLINVLMGQMSLVGPRPPLATEVSMYEDHVHRRLYIKPGLTGMWQVNGRSNLSWEDSVRLDLYYVENWSLVGDLIILWRTVKVVAQPVGAY